MKTGLFVAGLAASLSVVIPGPASARDADIAAGERVFRNQCLGCHSVAPGDNRAGPTLNALAGRQAGTLQGFVFSPAMSGSGIIWSGETLDAFLADPQAVVPGSRMILWGLDDQPRRNVIAYLESLND